MAGSSDRQRRFPVPVILGALAALTLTGATVSLFVTSPRADDALPMVRILEPDIGPARAPAPLAVPASRSVAVRGIVLNESPIDQLLLGGRRLAATFADDRMSAEFTGFIDATDLRRDDTFEIEVRAINGSRAVRRFPARRMMPGESTRAGTPNGLRGPGVAAGGGDGAPGFEDVVDGDRRQRWAVVIGAGSFADAAISDRPDAERDARAMAAFLRSHAAGLGGMPDSHVRLLVGDDATARNVRSALMTFLRGATPEDLVVLYIAGRSLTDPDRPGPVYLLTHDTELDDIPATAIRFDLIERAVADLYAANRVILMDAGHDLDRAVLHHASARQGGLAVLTAGDVGAEGDRDRGFTRAVLDGLDGAADSDGDGIVRLDELVRYAPAAASQTTYDRYWPLAWAQPARVAAEP